MRTYLKSYLLRSLSFLPRYVFFFFFFLTLIPPSRLSKKFIHLSNDFAGRETEVELSTRILLTVVSRFSLCLLSARMFKRQISTEESTFSPVHPVPPKPLKPALKRPSVVERPTEIPTSKSNTEHVPNHTLLLVHYSAVHLLCANLDGVVLSLNCPPLLSPTWRRQCVVLLF